MIIRRNMIPPTLLIVAYIVAVAPTVWAFDPQPEPPLFTLQANTLKLAGKLAKCKGDAMARMLKRGQDPQPYPSLPDSLACSSKYATALSKAQSACSKAFGGTCPLGGAIVGSNMEDAMRKAGDFVVQDIAPLQRFKALGDGTLQDTRTGLQWELKTDLDGVPNFGNLHDADNTYDWSFYESGYSFPPVGSAFAEFLYGLNHEVASPFDFNETSGCFAGHCDWRIPTKDELSSIQDLALAPRIDPAVGPTAADYYWTATSNGVENNAILVGFGADTLDAATDLKSNRNYVRAVRGPNP